MIFSLFSEIESLDHKKRHQQLTNLHDQADAMANGSPVTCERSDVIRRLYG